MSSVEQREACSQSYLVTDGPTHNDGVCLERVTVVSSRGYTWNPRWPTRRATTWSFPRRPSTPA